MNYYVSTAPRPAAPPPDAPVRRGSDAQRILFCRTMLDTHDPYRPALIDRLLFVPGALRLMRRRAVAA
ncbi:hypothetical protein U1839_21820 [Sphingomonas sp. RT2P30]|uniref:hypothetical protein n=1 Tax=Parasphingomonas halimpatiens TaxID=3096162 RepID=UPI002FCC4804